jgi:hypothetical protein
MLKDVGSQKVDITIKQLLLMVSLTQKELRKGLLALKVPKVLTPLNAKYLNVNVIQSLMCNVMDQCYIKCWWMEG